MDPGQEQGAQVRDGEMAVEGCGGVGVGGRGEKVDVEGVGGVGGKGERVDVEGKGGGSSLRGNTRWIR